MKKRIYLDNNATTQLDPFVIEAMIKDLQYGPSNPSSVHSFGQDAKARLTKYRRSIAEFLKVKPTEIIFTSGGTEGINNILRGLPIKSGHVITSSVEHSSVFNTFKAMSGYDIAFLNPGLFGAISPEDVKKALKPNTCFIAIMAVNNETGVKTDLNGIAEIAYSQKIPLFVDGVSLLGKEPFMIPDGVSAMSFSAHKFHGPQGVGFVFVRNGFKLKPLLTGGLQEFGRRAGTENLSGIAGMAAAVEVLKNDFIQISARMESLRDRLEKGIFLELDKVFVNGEGPRVVNTSNLAFGGVEGESLLACLDLEGIVVSHGSACSSGALEPSRILLNMGIPTERARSSIRISLSRLTTEEEIDRSIETITQVVKRLRG